MSTNFKHSHRNTIDAYKQSTLNPPSSTIPSAPDMREDDISSCTTFGTISQQQEDTTTTTTRRGKKTTTVRGAAIDTITMGHAVRVPHALQSATRRTMLDILTQLNREKSVNETDECVGNSLAHGRKLLYDGVNTNKNPSILVNATTIAASTSTSHVLPDLSRSLRHLLPSRRGNAANTRQQCSQRQEELLHAEEDSISEFEDDDNNNNNNNVHMKKEKKRGSDETRGVQEPYLINEECLANDQTEPYSFPRTVLDREEGQRRGRHRSWAKLFNCDDLHNDDPSIQDSLHTVQQQQQQQQELMPKFTPVTRVSTKSSHRSSSSLHAVWADVEDERRSSTAGRTSLATLLDAAEAEDDERRRSFSHLLAAEKTEKKGMEYEEEGENNNHSMLLLSSHTFGKPSFGAMGLSLNNGSSSSASAVAALLQGSSSSTIITSTSAVVKRGGGVCRGRMSAALKQLSGNPTSARVVTYLARSFDDWRLDAPAISQFNKEMEEGRANSTLDESSKYTLLSGTSGVQLKLRVVMVENTYSIYCLRVEIVWADEQTSMELGYDYNNNNNNTTVLSTTTAMEEHDDDEGESLPPCSVERNKLWTVALTTPSFQSTPIVVGEHLYLARPFFCYPSIQTIVASLNITSDSALRQPQPTRQGRRRRPREEISSQEQQQQEQKQQKQEQENDPQNCMMGYEKMSMDTTTPERPSRPAISLSAPSPFAAYDPFLNTPTNPFRKSTVDTDPSAAFSQRQQQVGRSLKMTSEEEENNNNNNNNMSDNSISVSIQQTVKHDIIGDHFPRGPGEEWDVPLEVLLALCPIQNPAAFTSSAADADNFFSPSAVQSWMRSGGDVVSSSISSLSSVDEDDEVPPTLTNQKVSAWRYDDVLLSD